MPRYFFDVYDGIAMLADVVGDDFDDDEAAADQAVSLIPELERYHTFKNHDITVAASLRDERGSVICRSIGIVRSQRRGATDSGFSTEVQGIKSAIVDPQRLREELKELRRKLLVDIDGMFSRLEVLASVSDVLVGHPRGRSGMSD